MSGSAVSEPEIVSESEVVHLSDSDDPVEYVMIGSPIGSPDDGGGENSDYEIVSVERSATSRTRRLSNGIEEVSVEPAQDVAIVEERVLTAQERLNLIREKHLRGESIAVPGQRPDSPHSASPVSPYESARDMLWGMQAAHSAAREWEQLLDRRVMAAVRSGDLTRTRHRNLYDRILDRRALRNGQSPQSLSNEFVAPFTDVASEFVSAFANGPRGEEIMNRALEYQRAWGAQHSPSIEESNVQAVLQRSMQDTHKRYKTDNVDIPDPPTSTREGFARSVKELKPNEALVCIECGHELGKPNSQLPKGAAERSGQVFVRGCGHVYCGECTFALQGSKTRKRPCPVKDGQSVTQYKRNKFRQIYI